MIDALANATQMSVLTRFLANIFIFLVLVMALLAAGYQLLNGQPINPLLTSILATGVGYALHMLGLNQGVTLEPVSPMVKSTPQSTPPPPPQA